MSIETFNFDEYAINRSKFNDLPLTYGMLAHEIILRLYAYACSANPIAYKGDDYFKVNMTKILKNDFRFYSSLGSLDARIGFITRDFIENFSDTSEGSEKEFENLTSKAMRGEDGYFLSVSKYIVLIVVVKEKEEGDLREFEEISFYINKPNSLRIRVK